MALLFSLKDHRIMEILVDTVAEFLTERVKKFINNKLMIYGMVQVLKPLNSLVEYLIKRILISVLQRITSVTYNQFYLNWLKRKLMSGAAGGARASGPRARRERGLARSAGRRRRSPPGPRGSGPPSRPRRPEAARAGVPALLLRRPLPGGRPPPRGARPSGARGRPGAR